MKSNPCLFIKWKMESFQEVTKDYDGTIKEKNTFRGAAIYCFILIRWIFHLTCKFVAFTHLT